MLCEWTNSGQMENQDCHFIFDLKKWICNCEEYLHSAFFLCKHLVKGAAFRPRYYSDIVLRDYYPFISINNNSEYNIADDSINGTDGNHVANKNYDVSIYSNV